VPFGVNRQDSYPCLQIFTVVSDRSSITCILMARSVKIQLILRRFCHASFWGFGQRRGKFAKRQGGRQAGKAKIARMPWLERDRRKGRPFSLNLFFTSPYWCAVSASHPSIVLLAISSSTLTKFAAMRPDFLAP